MGKGCDITSKFYWFCGWKVFGEKFLRHLLPCSNWFLRQRFEPYPLSLSERGKIINLTFSAGTLLYCCVSQISKKNWNMFIQIFIGKASKLTIILHHLNQSDLQFKIVPLGCWLLDAWCCSHQGGNSIKTRKTFFSLLLAWPLLHFSSFLASSYSFSRSQDRVVVAQSS